VSFGNTDAVTSAQTWNDFGAPFYVMVRTFVRAALTVAAGVEVEFAQDASLVVAPGGSLRVSGSQVAPVALRGREDLVGYWKGIEYGTAWSANVLEWVSLSNAGSSAWFGSADNTATLHVGTGGVVSLRNVTFPRTGGYAVIVRSGRAIACSAVDDGGFRYFSSAAGSASSVCP
jgi:hypothetical protein